MFTFHKPKVFRSVNGCCICRAKSSSSRFTDSKRYETSFPKCFDLDEERSGEICNACVLLVKRYLKLPEGSTRHWSHVVDARSGPGTKSLVKSKNKKKILGGAVTQNGGKDSPVNTVPETPEKVYKRKHVYKSRKTGKPVKRSAKVQKMAYSDFLDMTVWRRQEVCCGTIFRNEYGEVVIDRRFYVPCKTCLKEAEEKRAKAEEAEETSSVEGKSPKRPQRGAKKSVVYDEELMMMETEDDSVEDEEELFIDESVEEEEDSHLDEDEEMSDNGRPLSAAESTEAAKKLAEGVSAAATASTSSKNGGASSKASSVVSSNFDEGFFDKAALSPSGSAGSTTPPPATATASTTKKEDERPQTSTSTDS